jgi:hypothetical protein
MIADFSFQHFRFHLTAKTSLHIPAYNTGQRLSGAGLGARFACLRATHRQVDSVSWGISKAVFVLVGDHTGDRVDMIVRERPNDGVSLSKRTN